MDYLCPVYPKTLFVRGHFNAAYFDYLSVKVRGCRLGSECYDDKRINDEKFSFLTLKVSPSLGESEDDSKKMFLTAIEDSYVNNLDSELRQSTNIYYMQSAIKTNDNIFDIF